MSLLGLITIPIACAFEKHYYSKEQIYKRDPKLWTDKVEKCEKMIRENTRLFNEYKEKGITVNWKTGRDLDNNLRLYWTAECICYMRDKGMDM